MKQAYYSEYQKMYSGANRRHHAYKAGAGTIVKYFAILLILVCYPFENAHAGKYALLIGVADYKYLPSNSNDGKSDLKGPLNDVQLMFEALTDRYGFPVPNITILTDKNATRQNIINAFNRQFIYGSQPGDLLVFYFAGHGSQVPDLNDDGEIDGLDEVLCPYDLVPKGGQNMILDDELGELLKLLSNRTVVVIIDSCYSGGALRGETDIIERYIPIIDYQPTPSAIKKTRGMDVPSDVIYMAASKEHKRSFEMRFDNEYYGVFTYELSSAMQRNYLKTYESLFQEAQKNVYEVLIKKDLSQEPQLLADPVQKKLVAFNQSPSNIQNLDNTSVANFIKNFDESVIVAVEATNGNTLKHDLMDLKNKLSENPSLKFVQSNKYHDLLIRVIKKTEGYYAEQINSYQNMPVLGPFKEIRQIINALNPIINFIHLYKKLVTLHNPNPIFKVNVDIYPANRNKFSIGEQIELSIQSEKDCHIILMSANKEGTVEILLPNAVEDGYLKGLKKKKLPSEKMKAVGLQFEISPPVGKELIKMIAAFEPRHCNVLFQKYHRQTEMHNNDSNFENLTNQCFSELVKNEMKWSDVAVLIKSSN